MLLLSIEVTKNSIVLKFSVINFLHLLNAKMELETVDSAKTNST